MQAIWRRMSRDGRHVAGADTLPLRQRERFVVAEQQMETGFYCRRRNVRRTGVVVDRSVRVVVQPSGNGQPVGAKHDLRFLGEYDSV